MMKCRPVRLGLKGAFAVLMSVCLSWCLYYLSVDFENSPFFMGFERRTFSSVNSTLPSASNLHALERIPGITVTSQTITSNRRVFNANITATSALPDNRSNSSANIFVNNSVSNIQSITNLLNSVLQHRDDNGTLLKSALNSTGKNTFTKTYRDRTGTQFKKVNPVTKLKLMHDSVTGTKGKNSNVTNTVTEIQEKLSEIINSTVNEQLSKRTKPKAVIIFTTKRSGSSFVGEFFNRHPDVYYIFEPLHSVQDLAVKDRIFNKNFLKTSLQVINGSFHCDFHAKDLSRFASEKFCTNNLQLYKNQLCKKGLITLPPSEAKVKMWEQECRKHKMVVIKLIRINNLEDLKPLMSQIDLEWRIIHLVRDPRPTEKSRKNSGRNYDLIRRQGTDRNDEVDLCETLQRNLKFWVDTPSWLKGRFQMTRFEDIAASPLKKAKELLEFVGLDLADDVVKWITENTEREKKSLIKPREFSTSRNSSKVLEAWRLNMDWTFVQRIQKVCAIPMKLLGYALIPDIHSLRDLNIPSTLPLS